MKSAISLLIILPLMALLNWNASPSNPELEALWSQVENLQRKGQPRAALKIVEEILKKAKNEEIKVHFIKAVQFKANLIEQLEESGAIKAMDFVERELQESTDEQKALLHVTLAARYTNYLRNQFYRLNNRTDVGGGRPDDKTTWSSLDFEEAITSHYLSAIDQVEVLQSIPIESYYLIINKGENSSQLMPSLYDFIAHLAIDHFSSNEQYAIQGKTKPIDWDEYLIDATEFINSPKIVTDNPGKAGLALELFQKLLKGQSSADEEDAYVYTELKRLQYIYSRAKKSSKGDLYVAALNDLKRQFSRSKESTLIDHALASHFRKMANAETDKTKKGELLVKAHEVLSRAIAEFKDGYGVQLCKNALLDIERPELSMSIERSIPIGAPALIRIGQKEIDQAFLRIFRVTRTQYIRYQTDHKYRQNLSTLIREAEQIQTRDINFIQQNNFVNYSSEHIIDELESGIYLIYVETENSAIKSHQFFHVTDIAFAKTGMGRSNAEVIVFNRVTGHPMEGVEIRLYDRSRGRNWQRFVEPMMTGITNINGIFTVENITSRSFYVEFIKNNDAYFPYENIYTGNFREYRVRSEATILTDRAIYRPGQVVFYKAIAYQKNERQEPLLLSDQDVVVELVNTHGKVVKSFSQTTNDYGSVSGEFQLPSSGLNGQYTIRIAGMGYHSIRVEEYKRPKFNVQLEVPEGQLTAGQSIEVPGLAKTFAGTAVENVAVSYQVTRRKEYHYYWWHGYQYGGGRDQGSQVIAVGNTTTDVDGKFVVPFEALVENENNDHWRPIYVYTINTDVVDDNGETRSGELQLRLGAEPYYVTTDISSRVNGDNFSSFVLSSKNAMGKPSTANVNVKIEKLILPEKLRLNRLWDNVDHPVVDGKQFEKKFPFLAHDADFAVSDYKIDHIVFEQAYTLSGEEEVELGKSLSPGMYRIVVLDEKGNEKYTNYFSSVSFDRSDVVSADIFTFITNKELFEVGERVKVLVNSPFPDSRVLVQVEKDHKIVEQRWHKLTPSKLIEIPVLENDRGGFIIRVLHCIENRMTSLQKYISVPWSNKKLDVSWETIRNNVRPGQVEKWRLTVSGPEKETVAAEVLASMYDASLDEFVPHDWRFNIFPTYASWSSLTLGGYGFVRGNTFSNAQRDYQRDFNRVFPSWKYLHGSGYFGNMKLESTMAGAPRTMKRMSKDLELVEESAAMDSNAAVETDDSPPNKEQSGSANQQDFSPRTNLNETVFFFPHLLTDKEGNIVLEFTMNEALTAWKLQILAHSKELKSALNKQEIISQKDLMIFPQIPRFMREGDKSIISAKINKLVDKNIDGRAWIEIKNARNGEDLTGRLVETETLDFTLENRSQVAVDFTLDIPQGFLDPIEIIVRAKAGKHTDGESNTLPVLTNMMLVTETLPMTVRANQQKTFNLDGLRSLEGKGIRPHRLTLEYMENPVWFAVQSLPYLKDYPHNCTEQVLHKIYANAIAGHIIQQFPKIQEVFRNWESKDELISNLNKNADLKSALIEETPWLREAESEEVQMKNIAMLFDYDRMAQDLDRQMNILMDRQLPSGGFPWFTGGRPNVYITQLVVEVFGHLQALNVDVPRQDEWNPLIHRALTFAHDEMKRRYGKLSADARKANYLDQTSLHAIYISSFYTELTGDLDFNAWIYYYNSAQKTWVDRRIYDQALLASAFYRLDNREFTEAIVTSFKDRALRSDELGMYWKYNQGYYWYNQPIETQAHVMEAVSLVDEDSQDLNEMRIWLLKNKQTNRWRSTVSTAKAIYALLLRGDDWLGTTKAPFVAIGDQVLSTPQTTRNSNVQVGTGYFKKSWLADEITSDMSRIDVRNENDIVSWGAVYWQYFQAIDEIEKYDENVLNIKRSLFKKIRSDSGEMLIPFSEGSLAVGEKVTVRLEIRVDRMMEFIHLKDIRAAGLEPIDVLSGYQWKGGLYYYQSTTDLGTHFFVDRVAQGTYVIEYDAFAVNAGDYSGGTATLQCMYAPEFASHAEGQRLQITR